MAVYEKKRFWGLMVGIVIVFTILLSLWPRSFLSSIDAEIKSVSVVIIENTLEHKQTEYSFHVGDSEFHEIMDVLNSYPYHISVGTISNRIKDTAHIEDNKAGYWLHIYMYTEPERHGDLYSISSGGTGELIFDYGVYRMGYWGNKTHLKFMNEICQIVASERVMDTSGLEK